MTATAAAALHSPVLDWYAEHARDLPWRRLDCSRWGVLVSEVMLQQTPVARVLPVWREWMRRWPSAADLAGAPPGEAVRAWGRLGYPRRAMRLHAAASVLTREHGGQVPRSPEMLRSLPGVGDYTAAAVSAFAFGDRSTVLDTNVRRVLARALGGEALSAPSLSRAETARAAQALPHDDDQVARWNASVMELGALVCTAAAPACPACPINDRCAWRRAGHPAYTGPPRRRQGWEGTDRQCRGALLHALRQSREPLSTDVLARAWPEEPQRARCLTGLIADGLIETDAPDGYRLPG